MLYLNFVVRILYKTDTRLRKLYIFSLSLSLSLNLITSATFSWNHPPFIRRRFNCVVYVKSGPFLVKGPQKQRKDCGSLKHMWSESCKQQKRLRKSKKRLRKLYKRFKILFFSTRFGPQSISWVGRVLGPSSLRAKTLPTHSRDKDKEDSRLPQSFLCLLQDSKTSAIFLQDSDHIELYLCLWIFFTKRWAVL